MAPLLKEQQGPATIGSLSEELQSISKEFTCKAPTEVQEKIFDFLQKWKSSEILQEALKEGDVAPDFFLPDDNGKMISSVDLRARGPIVVIFFRGNYCAYCNAMLRMVRKYTPYFEARGATVVAISPQTRGNNKQIRKDAGLTFPVLSDTKNSYSQLCNIAYILDDEVRELMELASGKSFVEFNGPSEFEETVLPIPATYVIQSDGRVTYSFVDTDFTKRAEPLDVLNALPPLSNRRQSLQDKISIEMGRIRDTTPEVQLQQLFDAVEKLKKDGSVERQALKVGDKAPDFRFQSRFGDWVDSKKLRRNGPLIVTFHYGHALCNLQLATFQKYLPKFEAKGASLVAIASPTAKYQSSGIQFPILRDTPHQSIARQFDLLVRLPWLIEQPDVEIPMAATYIIDRSGIIVYSFVDADPTRRAEPLDVLESLPNPKQKAPRRGPFSLMFGRRIDRRRAKPQSQPTARGWKDSSIHESPTPTSF